MKRRQKVLRITAEAFLEFCLKPLVENEAFLDLEDIPKDLTIRGADFEPFDNSLRILVESSKIPPLDEGQLPDGWSRPVGFDVDYMLSQIERLTWEGHQLRMILSVFDLSDHQKEAIKELTNNGAWMRERQGRK